MFFGLFFILEALGESCSKYYGDYYKFVAQLNETVSINTAEIFNDEQDYSNYKLVDQDKQLQLQYPIQQIGSNIIDDDEEQIVIRLSSIFDQTYGMQNIFALFRIAKSNYEILYSSYENIKLYNRIPKFDEKVILDSTENIKCHDFVLYEINQFVVDCYELQGENPKNFFFYIKINFNTKEIEKTKIYNNYQFSSDYKRELQLSSVSEQYYLYRITQNMNDDNSIEVFTLNLKSNEITLITKINKQFFIDQQFTKEYPEYNTFYIQNVKSDYFSTKIALTDSYGYLLVLTYDKNVWQLKVELHAEGIGIKNFDYKFENQVFAVQSKNSLIVRNISIAYQINFEQDISTYRPSFTKSFIVLKNSENLFLICNQLILEERKGQFSADLFDYFEDDFLFVEKNTINRYYAENNLKIIFHPSDQADLNNHQAQIQYKDCQVQLEYQAIQSTFTQLIQVRKEINVFAEEGFIILPTFSWTTSNDYVYGPLKQKSFLNKNETINQQLQFLEDIEVGLLTILTDIQFLRVIYKQSKNIQQSYIILSHNQTNILTIKSCIFSHQKQECNQEIYYTLEQGLILTDYNSAFEYFDSNLIIYTCDALIYKTTINIESGKTEVKKRKMLGVNQSTPQIGLLKQSVITWSEDSNIIKIINKETLKLQYYLFSSQDQVFYDYNADTIYTYHKEQKVIYQLIVKSTMTFASLRLMLENEIEDVKLFFSDKLFSLVQKYQDGQFNIKIWNKESEINSFFIKQLPLYSYEITDMNDISFSQTHPILYVKSKTNLLVYFIDQPNHNSLRNVIQIDEKLLYFQGVYGLLFGVVDKQLKLYSFNYLNEAQYRFEIEKQDFVDKRDYLIQYANKDNKITLEQNLKIFNYHIKITLNQENLKIITNLTQADQHYYIQDLGTNWYAGLVTEVKSVGQEKFAKEIQDAEDFNDESLLIIYNNNFSLVLKSDGSIIKQFQFKYPFICKKILQVQFSQSAFLDCSNRENGDFYLVSIVCNGNDCKKQ